MKNRTTSPHQNQLPMQHHLPGAEAANINPAGHLLLRLIGSIPHHQMNPGVAHLIHQPFDISLIDIKYLNLYIHQLGQGIADGVQGNSVNNGDRHWGRAFTYSYLKLKYAITYSNIRRR